MFGGSHMNYYQVLTDNSVKGETERDSGDPNAYVEVEGSTATTRAHVDTMGDLNKFDSKQGADSGALKQTTAPRGIARRSAIIVNGQKNMNLPGSEAFEHDIQRFNEHIA